MAKSLQTPWAARDLDLLLQALEHLSPAISIFDGDLRLVYANRRFGELLGIPESLCRRGTPFEELIRHNAERGEYGEGDMDALVQERIAAARRGEPHRIERTRPGGTVLEITGNPLPGGGFITIYTDITERRTAARALHDSEQRLRAMFEHAAVGIMITGPDGLVSEGNRALRHMLGYGGQEIGTLNWWDLVDSRDRPFSFVKHEELIAGQSEHYRAVKRFQRKDGTVLWGDATTSAIRDEQGGLEFACDVIIDITEQKAAEQKMQESEQRLRDLAESVRCAIYRCAADEHWTMEFVSGHIATLTGYPADGFINNRVRRFADIIHPEDRSAVAAAVSSAIAEDRRWELEYRVVHADGSERWLRDQGQAIADRQGRVKWREGFLVDETERKATIDELRRLRNLLVNIVNSMPSVLVGIDEHGHVTQWNREAERVTGLDSTHAQGQPLDRVYPNLSTEMKRVGAAIRERRPVLHTKVERAAGDEIRYDDITIYPLLSNGMEGAVIRVDDVTERVRVEQMMLQTEKMLSLGGLAAGMAHEINNPLAGILQNMQLIRNRLSADLRRNVQEARECNLDLDALQDYLKRRGLPKMMDAVTDSGRRAARIVDNMLSFSRKSMDSFAEHDLVTLLDRTVELASGDYSLRRSYDFRRIAIQREYATDVPLVRCEPGQIQQVFFNLLKNAAEAMRDAQVSEPRLRLRIWRRADNVCVEIEDNAPGMDKDTCQSVFEPFFTTKAAGVGTGLGLSVSYFIVTENHGGSLSVDSAPGDGTRFEVCLPIATSQR